MNKSEVVRRQLGTALALYLEDRDPVSIHVLTCAGAEIADNLSVQAGRKFFRLFRTGEKGREISDNEYFSIRNTYYNAFKHDKKTGGKLRDDTEILNSFSPEENDARLFTAWFDYACAGFPHPAESHIFQAWYLALFPEKMRNPDGASMLADLEKLFPELPSLPRERQRRRLKQAIAEMKGNRRAMADPRVDPRPLMLGGLLG